MHTRRSAMWLFPCLFAVLVAGRFDEGPGPVASALAAQDPNVARWRRQAHAVTIIRDDWGLAHVYGKTEADAVLGAEDAQAEDDLNRIETNYPEHLGRIAQA